jgi:hypothetical protein
MQLDYSETILWFLSRNIPDWHRLFHILTAIVTQTQSSAYRATVLLSWWPSSRTTRPPPTPPTSSPPSSKIPQRRNARRAGVLGAAKEVVAERGMYACREGRDDAAGEQFVGGDGEGDALALGGGVEGHRHVVEPHAARGGAGGLEPVGPGWPGREAGVPVEVQQCIGGKIGRFGQREGRESRRRPSG